MYAKINGGTVVKFPYSVGQLRKDNPNVSFPKNITQGIMQKYGMVSVHTVDDPEFDTLTHKVVQASTPTRESSGNDFDGNPIHTGRWILTKTVVALTADEIAENSDSAATSNRKKRNTLLAETDYLALTDVTLDAITTTYRQALRDITDHANWPHLEEGDWPVKL
tara:strand:+ start:3743 stop:4237 length:495 start_codon:yes stop_codon:yes gene_type:complete